jgi:hypothetical protein
MLLVLVVVLVIEIPEKSEDEDDNDEEDGQNFIFRQTQTAKKWCRRLAVINVASLAKAGSQQGIFAADFFVAYACTMKSLFSNEK